MEVLVERKTEGERERGTDLFITTSRDCKLLHTHPLPLHLFFFLLLSITPRRDAPLCAVVSRPLECHALPVCLDLSLGLLVLSHLLGLVIDLPRDPPQDAT